jgi:hypothetical protein
MEAISGMDQLVLGVIATLGESPLRVAVLMVILPVGILLLVFAYWAQKWTSRCFEEQRRLNVLFEDQMFLLSRYNEDLMKLKDVLSDFKEDRNRTMYLEAPEEPASSAEETTTEPISSLDSSEGEDSISTISEEHTKEEEEEENYEQQVLMGKKLIEEKVGGLAQEAGVPIKEVTWLTKPSMIGRSLYTFVVSTEGREKVLTFQEREIVGLAAGGKEAEAGFRALVDKIKNDDE